jgi:hypothetical protein
MLTEAGGITCSFNATVSEKTVYEIPDMVKRAQKHADIVHTMVFILFRSPELTGDFDFSTNGEKVEFGSIYKETQWGGQNFLMAPEIVEKIREADHLYQPPAYSPAEAFSS